MESREKPLVAASVASRLAKSAYAAQSGATTAAIWRQIETALAPIIGQRGVAALYQRSLHLAAASHPWLAGVHQGAQATMDLALLESAFARQDSAEAAAAGRVLLRTMEELLASLIGGALSERLLRSALTPSATEPPPQDTPS